MKMSNNIIKDPALVLVIQDLAGGIKSVAVTKELLKITLEASLKALTMAIPNIRLQSIIPTTLRMVMVVNYSKATMAYLKSFHPEAATRDGNFSTLFSPGLWKVLHAF